MITRDQLRDFVIAACESGVRYWYGTCYYKCTSSLLSSKAKQYPSAYTTARMAAYRKDIQDGATCADCVGLIKGAAWTQCGTVAKKYGGYGCPDKSANGMLAYCKSKGMANGTMDSFPDEPGLLLQKDGHVGVSIGGGYAIEAKSFAADVVKSKVEGRGWTAWARLPFVDYGDSANAGGSATVPATDTEKPSAPASTPATFYALGDRTLRRGAKGADVIELQEKLISLGYDCGKWGADGDFGNATEAALKSFQREYGISDDGAFGKTSLTTLNAAIAGTAVKVGDEGGAEDKREDADSGSEGSGSSESADVPAKEYAVTIVGSLDLVTQLQATYGGLIRERSD